MEEIIDRTIVIREEEFTDRQELLRWLGEELSFENFSGASLDAFYDGLTDIFKPLTIEIITSDRSGCSQWMHEVCRVLKAAAEERQNITVRCINRDME